MNRPSYLLLKANADQLPLRANSVSLVIATPPYLGERRTRKNQYCTSDAQEYERWLRRSLAEATRIVKPGGTILLHNRRPRRRTARGERLVEFDVLQKALRGGGRAPKQLRTETFVTRFADVVEFSWWALPVRLYRTLIGRYSLPGETLAHIFSGSGNSGLAALELSRSPVLVDLHHHRQVQRRLRKKMRSRRASRPHLSARNSR